MCGRYATTRSAVDLAALFEALDETAGHGLVPDYNVAPTDQVPIIRMSRDTGARELVAVRWGLVPHWAKDARGAARMINARAETVATSPAFAPSFATKRCLIPADGWYEWRTRPETGKQAYFITSQHSMTQRDSGVLAFGGIWARWGERYSCAIITTAAIGPLAEVHDRMPLLVASDRWAGWLGIPPGLETTTAVDVDGLLAPPSDAFLATLEIRPVGPAVGDVRNDGQSLTVRVQAPATLF